MQRTGVHARWSAGSGNRPGIYALSLPTFWNHSWSNFTVFRPGGSFENSPAIYRWVREVMETIVPEGRLNASRNRSSIVPPGLGKLHEPVTQR